MFATKCCGRSRRQAHLREGDWTIRNACGQVTIASYSWHFLSAVCGEYIRREGWRNLGEWIIPVSIRRPLFVIKSLSSKHVSLFRQLLDQKGAFAEFLTQHIQELDEADEDGRLIRTGSVHLVIDAKTSS